VDGRIVPLTYELKSGEQVEVLTTRNGTPSRDWLNPYLGYLKTSRARAKVRAWFRQQDQEKNIAAGRIMLDRELNRLGVSNEKIETLSTKLGFDDVNDFLSAIGRGEVTQSRIATHMQKEYEREEDGETELLRQQQHQRRDKVEGDVSIHGVGNLMTNIARCCKPLPGDEIVGYITKGRGVSIHRKDCPNILRLEQDDRGRLIQVSWGGGQEENAYPVDINVLAYDRQGLLRDITAIFTSEKVNVLAVNTMTDIKDHMARMSLTVEIVDIDQLSRILMKISQLSNVVEVRRKT
jgi:GTP pyrophosphokinase